jgi:hypothetical protein
MERKVTEWGCMQALIDYDGWRKWKDYAKQLAAQPKDEAAEKAEKKKKKAEMMAQFSRPPPKFDGKDKLADPPKDKLPKNTVDPESAKAEATANVSAQVNHSSSAPAAPNGPGHQNGAVKKPGGRGHKRSSTSSAGLEATPESKEEG